MSVHIQKSSLTPTINASALVDVAFQLIIFFVLVARFDSVNKELPVTLPRASAAAPLSFKPTVLIISVTKEGQIAVSVDQAGNISDHEKRIVTEAELDKVLAQAAANNQDRQSVKIRADEACRLQSYVNVVNACKKAGIRDYDLETDGGP